MERTNARCFEGKDRGGRRTDRRSGLSEMVSTATATTTTARLFEHISTEAADALSSGRASASRSTGRPCRVVVVESAPTWLTCRRFDTRSGEAWMGEAAA